MSNGLAPRKAFPVLETLHLEGQSNLEKICHGELIRTESFSHLTTITVHSCDRLKNLFPFSIARNLNQLQKISVSSCEKITEIVSWERKDDNDKNGILEFRSLSSLELSFLQNFKSFYSQETTASSANNTESIAIPLFNPKVSCPALESLNLVSVNGVEKIWHGDKLSAMSFGVQSLISLTIWNCSNSFMVKSFVQLKTLEVSWCVEMESIIEGILGGEKDEEARISSCISLFCKLDYLKLYHLPKLKMFCPGINIAIEFPSLRELEILKCPLLKTFPCDSTNIDRKSNGNISLDQPQHLFNEKHVSCPALEKLHLDSMTGIEKIWKGDQLSVICFGVQSLTTLKVQRCHKLKYVFTSSMIKSLVQLKELSIERCENIQEITQGEDDDDDDEINFPRLNHLELNTLPKLESFCSSGNYSFGFPSLQIVTVEYCPKMKMFSQGNSNTPMLHKVRPSTRTNEGRWEGSLNSTIRQLFREKRV
ncbi:hypothetical protein V6N12_034855 [Hibiscus sabdariffa]|uniref:Disease resistance protein At4g27190-like leucine-rich repeats domain-containing protein n=1 Tax=Hibiscus sabdariffa TaxID=183260 RepID=A0ABR2BPF8_9ROSI